MFLTSLTSHFRDAGRITYAHRYALTPKGLDTTKHSFCLKATQNYELIF